MKYYYTNVATNGLNQSCRRLDCLHVSEHLLQFTNITRWVTTPNKARYGSSHYPVYFTLKFKGLTRPERVGKGTWREPQWIYFGDYLHRLKDSVHNAVLVKDSLEPELRLTSVLDSVRRTIQKDAKQRAICLQAERAENPEAAEEQARQSRLARSPFEEGAPSELSDTAIKARVKTVKQQSNILTLKAPNGTLHSDTDKICAIAGAFYKDIYKHKGECENTRIFLDAVPEETKTAFQSSVNYPTLEAPFTEKEVYEALKAAQHKSAPGMDGFSYKFYMNCWEELKDLLLEVFELAASGTPVSRTRNTSVIRLLAKDGDPTNITNYRPISLINTELKIFTHVINRRIQQHLDSLVHPAQTGFIPGRTIQTNLDLMDHYYNVYGRRKGWYMGLLDFRKAYDSISQEWIIAVLENVGFKSRMINCVKSIQSEAASMINIRGVLSDYIPIESGVRQGCPLSPTLFALAIDPFIRTLEKRLAGLHSFTEPPKHFTKKRDGNFQHYGPDGRLSKAFFVGKDTMVRKWRPSKTKKDPYRINVPHTDERVMKVSAYADDVALYMRDYTDLQTAGEVICDFSAASKLCLNPAKTVIQWARGNSPPDVSTPPRVSEILERFWPTAPPKEIGGPPQCAIPQKPGTLFRYLGIHFGEEKKVTEYYLGFIENLKSVLRGFALYGLPPQNKAWLINIFFFSKMIYHIPYVPQLSAGVIKRFVLDACDKINGRLADSEEARTRRRFNDVLIMQPLKAGGLGLRNLNYQAMSLKAARAARFLREDTPARQNVFFHFASESLPQVSQEDTHPGLRMAKTNWFYFDYWKWSHFVSKTLDIGLRSLVQVCGTTYIVEPNPIEPATALQNRKLETCRFFYRQRLERPVGHMTEYQISYLLKQVPLTPREASNEWRNHFTVMKNARWKEILPPTVDPNNEKWIEANTYLGKHYRRHTPSAQTLHMLRLCRLSVVRHPKQAKSFAYRAPGCGMCREYTAKDNLHKHIFVDCPAMKAMCEMAGSPRVNAMADWVLAEAQSGYQNAVREAAHAIWQFERTMRKKGLDGRCPNVQRNHTYLFARVHEAIEEDMKLATARRKRAEAVEVEWLED
ncbi:LINE-1 reverse transcriptase-like protein [Yarrowia sp. C11]|nr:LINE-1 reverse transcriptase-like protein [Yarrowia sp. C11]KAG5370640.1 LINE-1 reverse transcriptase-like protein [Yarrowia sp. E02]